MINLEAQALQEVTHKASANASSNDGSGCALLPSIEIETVILSRHHLTLIYHAHPRITP